ncbi:MAG: DUF6935 domain-containing protein [Acutalibacteraceae bacterium]
MALFDMLKSKAKSTVTQAVKETVTKAAQNISCKTEKVVFNSLPSSLEEFKALPQAALSTPFDTAAMTVLALCFYPQSKELCYEMLDYLRGPRPMNGMDKQFIADRFRSKDYVPRSYFAGATPQNDYQPSEPYTVTVSENPHSYDSQGYVKLFIPSGGADSPRPIQLREAKDGKWYLWEQFLLADIRQPESANPWA